MVGFHNFFPGVLILSSPSLRGFSGFFPQSKDVWQIENSKMPLGGNVNVVTCLHHNTVGILEDLVTPITPSAVTQNGWKDVVLI